MNKVKQNSAQKKPTPKKPGKQKPICLITGASAGIGAALAREFAKAGWDLALTARRKQPMQELAKELEKQYNTQSHIVVADLAKPGAIDDILTEIWQTTDHIDGLVNNAGHGLTGTFLESDWSAHADFIRLMLTAPTELSRKLLPGMVERGFGRIINVASLAGHLPGSRGHTLYAAVKSYLIKFSQSLNLEMRGKGVKVSALCPGFTMTEFHDVNGTREAVSKMPNYMWMSAEQVAKSGFIALEQNRAVYIPGRINRGIAVFARLIPAKLALHLMHKNSEKIRKTK